MRIFKSMLKPETTSDSIFRHRARDYISIYLDRMNFLSKVDVHKVSPALAIMYLEDLGNLKDLGAGFKESAIKAENESNRKLFLDYYEKHKDQVVRILKKNCKKNVTQARAFLEEDQPRFDNANMTVDIRTQLESMSQHINFKHDVRTRLEAILLMARNEYMMKKQGIILDSAEHWQDEAAGKFRDSEETMTTREMLALLDRGVGTYFDEDIKVDHIDNEWNKIMALKYRILFMLHYKRPQRNNFDSPYAISIPSMTPEGMISVWDTRPYPTLFKDIYVTSTDETMKRYLSKLFFTATDE